MYKAVVCGLFFLLVFSFIQASQHHTNIPESSQSALQEVKKQYFKEAPLEVAYLPGGHSNTCLRINAQDKQYVLRIKKDRSSIADIKRELFAMQEAAAQKIAPAIYYITPDKCAVLMEYIHAPMLSLEASRKPENIQKIAHALSKIHAMPRNPHFEKSGIESVREVYQLIKGETSLKSMADKAWILTQEYNEQLETAESKLATVHGDLNPRNILLWDDRAVLIDWEYTGWEDPFMDLSYLSLRLDYQEQEEHLFLEYYLQRKPTQDDIKRYSCAKKLNLAELTIYFLFFSRNWQQAGQSWDYCAPLQKWSHYVKKYVDKGDPEGISLAQYYYDLARCCLSMLQ